MSEGKHTPGPWCVVASFGNSRYIEQGGKDLFEIVSNRREIPQGEQDANAALIAAAPEMLEALKEAVELCCDACDWSVMTPEERDGCVTNKWRKIIAKAEGEDYEPCRKN